MKRDYKRRNIFINKGFQGKFIARFLAVTFAGVVVSVALFNFLAYRKIDRILFSMRVPEVDTGHVLFREAVVANGIALVLTVLAFFLVSRGIQKKITGALHRIMVDLHKIREGILGTRIHLRKDDEFKDFADDLNFMAGELHRRFSGIKEQFEMIDASVREMKGDSDGDGKICREKILPQVAALEERLSEFKK